jgi:hypothetical protein
MVNLWIFVTIVIESSILKKSWLLAPVRHRVQSPEVYAKSLWALAITLNEHHPQHHYYCINTGGGHHCREEQEL